MRGVRLPLPKQTHRVHLTARDQIRRDRRTSRALMADQDRDRDNSDLTPFWELVHPDNSEHDSVSTHSLTRLAQTLDLILFTDHAGGPMSHLVLVSGSRAFPSPDLVKHRIRTALTPGDRLMHERMQGQLRTAGDASALSEQRDLTLLIFQDGQSRWIRLKR